MLHVLQMAGSFGWPLAALGIVGLVASIACIAVASAKRESRFVFLVANVPTFFALASFGLGIVGLALGHSTVHAAVAAMPDVPSIRDGILYEGYKEAVFRVWAGLVSGALPLLLGIGVVGLGLARKRGAGGAALPIAVGAMAMAVAVISVVVGVRPLPGIDFSDAPTRPPEPSAASRRARSASPGGPEGGPCRRSRRACPAFDQSSACRNRRHQRRSWTACFKGLWEPTSTTRNHSISGWGRRRGIRAQSPR